jgi:hypothetical protein
MNVVAGIIGGVELNDPVDLGDVETAGGDVRAEEDAGGGVAELEEGVGALLLLLLALLTSTERRKVSFAQDRDYPDRNSREGRGRGHRRS